MSEIKTLFGLQSIKCEILHTPLILSPHSSRDGMPAVSKSKRKKAQVITQNRIDSLARSAAGKFKRIFDEITRSPQTSGNPTGPRQQYRVQLLVYRVLMYFLLASKAQDSRGRRAGNRKQRTTPNRASLGLVLARVASMGVGKAQEEGTTAGAGEVGGPSHPSAIRYSVTGIHERASGGLERRVVGSINVNFTSGVEPVDFNFKDLDDSEERSYGTADTTAELLTRLQVSRWKLATVFSPWKKRRCTEGKENKMPIDASSVAGASSTLPVNPPPRIDSDDPFLVSTGQFQLEGSGYTPPTEASTSTQRYWKLPKLPKPTVEEVDDNDTASISTFISPTPAHPLTEHLPSNLSLHDQSTDDFPWDFDFDDIYLDDLSVPEQEDELLATQAVPLFSDDGYPRPRPPTSFLQHMEQYSTRPGKLCEAPLVSEAELAAADVQKELRGDYRGSAMNVLFGRGGVGYRDPDVRELG
ncbi:hypothetical protein C8F01DRAFT_1093302 [Mycena amicta]|nr:hypothetical protein C8F01DRAFT_1093302 [Mycena amicta]